MAPFAVYISDLTGAALTTISESVKEGQNFRPRRRGSHDAAGLPADLRSTAVPCLAPESPAAMCPTARIDSGITAVRMKPRRSSLGVAELRD